MKKTLPIVVALLILPTSCTEKNFTTRKASKDKKAENKSSVDSNSPIDLGKSADNDLPDSFDGVIPQGGNVGANHRDFVLDCEFGQGAIIEVGDVPGGEAYLGAPNNQGKGITQDAKDDQTSGGPTKQNPKGGKNPAPGPGPRNDNMEPTEDYDVSTNTDIPEGFDTDNPEGYEDSSDDTPPGPIFEEPPIDRTDSYFTASVTGRFCPGTQEKRLKETIKIVFLVDFSGSMGRHRPMREYYQSLGLSVPEMVSTEDADGNDPWGLYNTSTGQRETCGRFEAANRILSAYAQHENIEVAVIPFASNVITNANYVRPLSPLGGNPMPIQSFCSYIQAENHPDYPPSTGAIPAITGLDLNARQDMTNYQAAFQRAQQELSRQYGRKLVYFITDGQPTITNAGFNPDLDQTAAASIAAGQALRDMPNLDLHAVVLGIQNPKTTEIFEAITKSPDFIHSVESVTDFIYYPKDYPLGEFDISLNTQTAAANLWVKPYDPQNLNLVRFDKINSVNEWEWQTQKFTLLGIPGQSVDNLVRVSAQDEFGFTLESEVIIRYYRPTN